MQNKIMVEQLEQIGVRDYMFLPLFVNASKLDDSEIENLFTVLEEHFNGIYRFSSEATKDVMKELIAKSREKFSHDMTYIGIVKKTDGKRYIQVNNNISDIGCTLISYLDFTNYVSIIKKQKF